MKGKSQFTKTEADQIRQLLREKSAASPDKQKGIRQKQRNLGFYLSDFPYRDFDLLERTGYVTVTDDPHSASDAVVEASGERDEAYVIDLCDQALGLFASRQHTFPFLLGDAGKNGAGRPLPVDAFYPELGLVIEYYERQHTEDVPFFNRRTTVSGVGRGEQRAIYDQRRRDVLPQHGIRLVGLLYTDFRHGSSKRLTRDRDADMQVVKRKLSDAGFLVI